MWTVFFCLNLRFEVHILGCGSATPSIRRNPAAQLINIQENFFLVDCGEGTQLQMRKFKIKFQRINHVFISHLHGDHYLGLIGLLQSMHLLGRKQDLHIFANEQLENLVKQHLKVSFTKLSYNLIFHALSYDEPQLLFENKVLKISSFVLKHRIPCCGFLFEEKKKSKHIIPEKIEKYQIPKFSIPAIKAGEDFVTKDGKKILNKELTTKAEKSFSYAYCSDTVYNQKLIPFIKKVDVLFHESTFTDELKDRAKETYHSTASQAAKIALEAEVGKLYLGHFSVRYKSLEQFSEQAKAIFPNTELCEDGLVIKLY